MAQARKQLNLVMLPSSSLDHITIFLELSNQLAAGGHRINSLLPSTALDKAAEANEFPDLITFHPIGDVEKAHHRRHPPGGIPGFDGSFIARGVEAVVDVSAQLMGRAVAKADQAWSIINKASPDFVVYDSLAQIGGPELGFRTVTVDIASVDSRITLCVVPSMKASSANYAPKAVDNATWRGANLRLLGDNGDGVETLKSSGTPEGMELVFYEYVEEHYGKLLLGNGPALPKRDGLGLEEEWAAWLAKFPPGSVVYCAFGKYVDLPKDQFLELLRGFELCGRPCLVARRPLKRDALNMMEKEMTISKGFGEKVMIYDEWFPRPHIMDHPSVGCFVTDCEVGSVWEALLSESQILLIPGLGDRHVLPAKLLTEKLKVAVEAEKDENSGWISKEKLCERIDMVMDGESEVGKKVRRHHLKLREGLVDGNLKDNSVHRFAGNLIRDLGTESSSSQDPIFHGF